MTAQERQGPAEDMTETGPASRPPLIVWSADAAASEPLLRALEPASQRALIRHDTLPDPTEIGTGTGADAPEMLLLCHSPARTLCRAMAAGALPSVALADWVEQARALLAVNRRNRRRVHILDIDRAAGDPGAVLGRFGLVAAAVPAPVPAAKTPDPVLLLLAQRSLAADPQVRALAGEMAAAAVGIDPGADDPDAAFLSYREVRSEAELLCTQAAELETTLAEAEGLRAERDAARQEGARLGRELEQARARAGALTGERDAAAAQVGKSQALLDAARAQTDLLQAQNRAAQDEMERLSRDRARLAEALRLAEEAGQRTGQEADLLRTQIALTQGEVETLEQAREQLQQRLAQLGQGIESQQAQILALEAERGALRQQLAGKDRALTAAGAAQRDLETQTAQLIAALTRLRSERTDMARRADDQQRRADDQQRRADDEQRRAEALDEQLRRFTASRSYRLTAPLRRLRALLSGAGRA